MYIEADFEIHNVYVRDGLQICTCRCLWEIGFEVLVYADEMCKNSHVDKYGRWVLK